MNRPTLEQLLDAACPEPRGDTAFTDRVMAKVQQGEIISQVVRRTNVKPKETFIMKLCKLQTATLVAIAIGTSLALAGTAYAAYMLWPKPAVQTTAPTTNKEGRLEIGVKFTACTNERDNASTYEVKKGSNLDPAKVPQILQARCEVEAINQWITEQHPETKPGMSKPNQDSISIHALTAYTIESITGNEMTLAAQPQYSQPARTLTITPEVKIISREGRSVLADLKPGDVVAPGEMWRTKIETLPNGTRQSVGKSEISLLYLFRMELPFEAYDPRASQSLAKREVCRGNVEDTCVETGSVDLYMGSYNTAKGRVSRSLQGQITTINGTSFTVKGSSGREVTFAMSTDIIADYNQHRSANYNNVKIGIGDAVMVDYTEPASTRSDRILGRDVGTVKYLIELVGKSDALKKY